MTTNGFTHADEGVRVSNPQDGHTLAIDALRAAGADKIYPSHFHFVETLARRISSQQGIVRSHLYNKLEESLHDLQTRFAGARSEAAEKINNKKNSPTVSPLSELTRYIDQSAGENPEPDTLNPIESPSELKNVRTYRNTWSKLSVDRQLTQAFERAPENAGPLNSHYLVLQSLAMMREISPDYLNRYMSYVDTLLCLDQAESKGKLSPKKAAKPRAKKSREHL